MRVDSALGVALAAAIALVAGIAALHILHRARRARRRRTVLAPDVTSPAASQIPGGSVRFSSDGRSGMGHPKAVRIARGVALRIGARAGLRRGWRGAAGWGAAGGVLCGQLLGGPVAAVVLGAYAGVGGGVVASRRIRRAEYASYRAAVDAVAGLAAEVRSGLQIAPALAAASAALSVPAVLGRDAHAVARRVGSAVAVAEKTGAPLADVLDRLDVHQRAVDRVRATVAAQAAGVQVSAALLAAMPVAGVGLGFMLGVDPLPILLDTKLGAACLVGAVVLQLLGLAWAARLARVVVAA